MTAYRSSLTQHLKNQSKLIARSGQLRHGEALEQACREYGFSTWKQALAHMHRVELLVEQARAMFPTQVKAQTAQISEQRGYPLLLDEHLAIRYDPSVPEQVESVARRRVLLDLFEQIHAPADLNSTESARLWFRPLMSITRAHEIVPNGRWRIRHLANAIVAAHGADVIVRSGYRDLTRRDIQDELTDYLHGLYSQSVSVALGGGMDEVLLHPGFKEFAGCALRALQDGPPGKDLTIVLNHAGVAHWVRGNIGSLDRERLFWDASRAAVGLSAPAIPFIATWPAHEGVSRYRPRNKLSLAQYTQLASQLGSVARRCPDANPVQQVLRSLRGSLASWMSEQFDDEALARRLFEEAPRQQQIAFLAPALANQLRSDLSDLRDLVLELYSNCPTQGDLFEALRALERAVHGWLKRTRNHWSRTTVKLEMDSIGLVAIDSKEAPYLEADSPWRRTEFMGTPLEESLMNAIRPHVFPEWKLEFESEGDSLNFADMESEELLREHLDDLAYYRYVGPAKTEKQFWKEVHDLVYFTPQHVWFKQKLIG